MSDEVNKPKHYNTGDIECIDAIRASMSAEEFAGYCKGNVIKYNWRYRYKDGKKDLEKAQWYQKRLIETFGTVDNTPTPKEVANPPRGRSCGMVGCKVCKVVYGEK